MGNFKELIKDLKYSLDNDLLINVYQNNSTIFYTGIVSAIDNFGAIIVTFNEYGLSDGLVYLTFGDIEEVDFYSEDLSKMEGRIQLARKIKLYGVTPENFKLNRKTDLLTQILGSSFVEQQPIMVVTIYGIMYEGFIVSLGDQVVTIRTIDKFNNENYQEIELTKNEIRLVEFLGQELKLISQSKKVLYSKHLEVNEYRNLIQIYANLHVAKESGKRVIMVPKNNPSLFFIGQVVSINNESVIFKTVDMAGQFGGYELIKLKDIQRVILKNDYLRLVNHFVTLNLANGNYIQPVLNDDRIFDETIDPFEFMIRQSINFKRVIRIKKGNCDSAVGFPISFDGNKVQFDVVDDAKLFVNKRISFGLEELSEIAFDYLDCYLIEKQIQQ
ncbi:hypothetical protein GSH19_00710 [Lactobacillus sp. S2-2]|uniref:hypothetical protein n=1 Tax=Lactobacillus sp. S2-2 TaxID=2692917 RepID=UPI001F39E85A|nr:hypothetical protein [Lactobacillus sp. S2-2]MCF6514708.1 hypothetical protein [Lactobacillus sp. S2-2]